MAINILDNMEHLDNNILATLPPGSEITSITPSGSSEFCKTYRVDVQVPQHPTNPTHHKHEQERKTKSFFLKISLAKGQEGNIQMTSSFISESSLHNFIPEFVPKPITYGSLKSSTQPENEHEISFLLSEFVDMTKDTPPLGYALPLPSPKDYMAPIIQLHKRSMAFASANPSSFFSLSPVIPPFLVKSEGSCKAGMSGIDKGLSNTTEQLCQETNGKKRFGFPINTRFGNLPQPNNNMPPTNTTWESFWTHQTKHYLYLEAQKHRELNPKLKNLEIDRQLYQLKPLFLEKVIPRYLRPLETNGRDITPALLHADLWPGNVRYRIPNTHDSAAEDSKEPGVVIYDAAVFWGHNEADLGLFLNPRYPLGQAYLDEYWRHIPPSEPKEDAPSRILLYLLRNQILLAVLYPQDPNLRKIFVETMKVLVDRVLSEEKEIETRNRSGV